MTSFLLLLAFAQDPPLAEELARIRSKPVLTEEEKKGYAFPPVKPLEGRRTYTLAVVPLRFRDGALGARNLSKLFFEDAARYFSAASGGRFELRGAVGEAAALDVERSKVAEADLAALAESRRGKADGVAIVAAVGPGARGSALWPHKERAREVEYILVPEEASGRELGIVAHEFFHLLGLVDKYGDKRSDVGKACILATGYNEKDPALPCADCRRRLGWAVAAAWDCRQAAMIVMEPDLTRSLKILVNPEGTEALLLEMQERLLVWHLGGGTAIEFVGMYPSEGDDRLTPFSDPPFRGRSLGAVSPWITDIRVEGGKAYFKVASEGALTALEEWRRSRVGRRIGD
ncbi:MAG TPA: hypothetical protein VJB14_16530 [Planctomycetota bacterium]|nr:hypothetical protein [Planctomycetota bacterium]